MSTAAYDYRSKVFELSKQGKYPEAYELVKEALSIYPSNPSLLNSEIYVIFRMGKIKEARQESEAQFHNLKNNYSFLRTYLSILDKSNAKDDILRLVDSGVFFQDFNGKANPAFFISSAKLVSNAGFPDKALEILRRAPRSAEIDKAIEDISKHGSKRGPVKNRYEEQYKGKHAAAVINEIESIRILSSYKGDFDLHHYLAEKYKKTGQLEKAAEIYKYLLTIKDDDFTRNRLGHLYKTMGLLDEAIIYLKEGLMRDPYKTHLYTALAEIYVKKKDPDGFERVAKDILAIHPGAGHLWGLLRRVKNKCSD